MNVSMIDGHIDEPKMTDEQIIKAWTCCTTLGGCKHCPLSGDAGDGCLSEDFEELVINTVDLINRQKAEISVKNKLLDIAETKFETIKAEAYKEFAERLKHMLGLINGFDYDCSTIFYHIDNLLKEMVGEE